MTDTPLDLDAIDARARAAANAPWGNAREHVCRNDVPALVAALRKAEAQVAAVLGAGEEQDRGGALSGVSSGRCVVTDERRVEVNPGLDIHLDRGPVE